MLVENALFATLDATVRRAEAEDGRVYTLTDTVGFVRNLPHQLVEAFRSTLEEVGQATSSSTWWTAPIPTRRRSWRPSAM